MTEKACSTAPISGPGTSESTGYGCSCVFLLDLTSSPTLWGPVSGGILISGHWVLLIYKRSKRVDANKNSNTCHFEGWNKACYQDEDREKEAFTVAFLCSSSEAVDSTVHRFWSCDREEISFKEKNIYSWPLNNVGCRGSGLPGSQKSMYNFWFPQNLLTAYCWAEPYQKHTVH